MVTHYKMSPYHISLPSWPQRELEITPRNALDMIRQTQDFTDMFVVQILENVLIITISTECTQQT